jgi:hypothetical protein
MAQSGYTPIALYYSSTTTNVPTNTNLVSGELAINITDGKLFYKDNSSVVQTLASKSATAGDFSNFTGAVTLAKGTTGQQPTGVAGMLRFNTTTTSFEGYNGSAWSSVGGAAISNDTTTASNEYPLFASTTSGSATTIYTSNAKLLYKPSTGDFQSEQLVAGNGLIINNQTINTSYSVPATQSAMSTGPITLASAVSVTLASGARWVIL